MKKLIPLVAALTFSVALPVSAQVGGAIAPATPAMPGLPTPATPGMDSTKPMPIPQGNGSKPGGTASGNGTLNGSGSGVGGTVNGSGGTSRDGSNLGVNGNATATGRSGTNSANGGRFDINTSSEMSMQSDLGLTAIQAKAVREYREANGPITSETQLRSIKGMGPKTRARMKDRLNFDDGSNGTSTTR
ncbi:MAG: helix-hairpin-helix domain-containing protein [Pseudomonadota bacterium]